MNQTPSAKPVLVQAISNQPAKSKPAKSSPDPDLAAARAAIRRCLAARESALNASFEEGLEELSRTFDPLAPATVEQQGALIGQQALANHRGNEAYRKTMPLLVSYEGIRDFLACIAYGIANDIVPSQKSNRLLRAAQVALNNLRNAPQPLKSGANTPSFRKLKKAARLNPARKVKTLNPNGLQDSNVD